MFGNFKYSPYICLIINHHLKTNKMILKCLDDFLPLRNVNDFVFKVLNKETDEELTWHIEDIIDEINRGMLVDWVDYYTKDNWFDGWKEWCEGDIYTILLIQENEDKIYRPFL